MCNAGCTGATHTQATFPDTTIATVILSAKGTKAQQLDEQTLDGSDKEKKMRVREGGEVNVVTREV